MQFQTLHQTVQYFAKKVQKFEIFENTACKKLQEDDLSSNQEGSSPLLSQLSSTVVRQLLDLKGKEKRSTVGSKKKRKKINCKI